MIPDNIKGLVKALIEKTSKKNVIWGKTARPNEFKLFLDGGALSIDCWTDLGVKRVELTLYNALGDVIADYILNQGDDDYVLLSTLNNVAKREFYKVDETIDHFFKEIQDSKSIGKREIENEDLPF